MINWKKSAKLNDMTVDELKVWFENHPKSNKRIIRICNVCNKEREIDSNQYRDLCQLCSLRTPKAREAARLKTIEQYSTQEARDAQANRLIEHNKTHPETRKANSDTATKRWNNQTNRDVQSERIKNSEAAKVEHENQRGGNDLVDHHYIYDHSDLSKNIVQMTRSDHTGLHRLLQKLGYIVPHINTEESV